MGHPGRKNDESVEKNLLPLLINILKEYLILQDSFKLNIFQFKVCLRKIAESLHTNFGL